MVERTPLRLIGVSRRISSLVKSVANNTLAEKKSTSDLEDTAERKETILVPTRLSERHRLIAEGRIPPVTYEFERELWAKRERFGQYGLASGVSPAELWPTVEEIEEENVIGLYHKYKDELSTVRKAEEDRKKAAVARLEEIEMKEEKYPELLKEFLESQKEVVPVKTKKELEEEQQHKDMLEFYGYEIDPSDPRFPILYDKMIDEKKKAAKLAEKEELTRKKQAARKKKDKKVETTAGS